MPHTTPNLPLSLPYFHTKPPSTLQNHLKPQSPSPSSHQTSTSNPHTFSHLLKKSIYLYLFFLPLYVEVYHLIYLFLTDHILFLYRLCLVLWCGLLLWGGGLDLGFMDFGLVGHLSLGALWLGGIYAFLMQYLQDTTHKHSY